ncbi:MAG: T9SS type A sorting domain-containing protein [Saprospiraceae bacterium]|nr:T9SS type A sorting domain-containing protein [Saprospiraceae bacterium]
MKHLFFILLTLVLYFSTQAQPVEFDTYFAFEDAVGRRDTVWYGIRLDATYGFDPKYEELVKQPIDSNTFVLLSSDISLDTNFYWRKLYMKGETSYAIGFFLIFVDAAYPIKMKMDTAFIKNFSWSEKNFIKYIGTWCVDIFVSHPWNDSTAVYDCIDLSTGELIISEPPSMVFDSCYCSGLPLTSDINIEGKGKVTLNSFAIWTQWSPQCKSEVISNSALPEKNDDAIVYPNPSNGTFTIQSRFNSGMLRILNSQGQTVSMETLRPGLEKYTFTLNPGLYVAVIEQDGMTHAVEKIVVIR